MSNPEAILAELAATGAAINDRRRRAARVVTEIILDRVVYGFQFGAPEPVPVFSINDGIGEILAANKARQQPDAVSSRLPAKFTSTNFGVLTRLPVECVPRDEITWAGNGRPSLAEETLPENLIMEPGTDRRDTFSAGDMENRHPIDWHRPASAAGEMMPSMVALRLHGNPYRDAGGTRAGALAYRTWEVLKRDREVQFTAIVNDVVMMAGLDGVDGDDAMIVRDVLRDLALFGLCNRYKSKNDKVVFVLD